MIEPPELPELVVLIEVARDDRRLLAVRLQFEAKHRAGKRLVVESKAQRGLERAVHHHAKADEAERGERLAEGVLDREGVADLVARAQEGLPRLPIADIAARIRRAFALELDERKDLSRAPASLEGERDERRHDLERHRLVARRLRPKKSPVSRTPGENCPAFWRHLSLAASPRSIIRRARGNASRTGFFRPMHGPAPSSCAKPASSVKWRAGGRLRRSARREPGRRTECATST